MEIILDSLQGQRTNNNQSNYDDYRSSMNNLTGGGMGAYGVGNSRSGGSNSSMGNQDRRGFALPEMNQSFGGGNTLGSGYNNSSGGYGNQGGSNQSFRGSNYDNRDFRGGQSGSSAGQQPYQSPNSSLSRPSNFTAGGSRNEEIGYNQQRGGAGYGQERGVEYNQQGGTGYGQQRNTEAGYNTAQPQGGQAGRYNQGSEYNQGGTSGYSQGQGGGSGFNQGDNQRFNNRPNYGNGSNM